MVFTCLATGCCCCCFFFCGCCFCCCCGKCAPKERDYDIDPDLFNEEPITTQPTSDYQSMYATDKIGEEGSTTDDKKIIDEDFSDDVKIIVNEPK